jgi:hypothetical protein
LTRLRLASLGTVATLAITGCAGTTLTQTWRDPGYSARPSGRVFVLAAMPGHRNPAQFENATAQALNAKGFQAVAASSVFPPGRLDRIKVKEYVDGNGIDLLVMEHLTTEAAAPVTVTSTAVQSNGWYGAYGATSTTTLSQGTDVTARIDVYDVRTEPDTLVWRGESNTVDMQGAAQSLAAVLADDLVKARILVK